MKPRSSGISKQQLVLLCQREGHILPAWPADICLRPISSFWEGQNGRESLSPLSCSPVSRGRAACAVGAHHSTSERSQQMHMDGICSFPFPPLCSFLLSPGRLCISITFHFPAGSCCLMRGKKLSGVRTAARLPGQWELAPQVRLLSTVLN